MMKTEVMSPWWVEPKGNASDEMHDYACLRQKMVFAVRAICPSWMANDQDDIVQMAMLSVLRQHRKNDGRNFTSSYLKKVAYTALVDEIRRVRSRGEADLVDEDGEHSPEEDPEQSCYAREIAVGVRHSLGTLAPPRRTAVTLYLLGYQVPQIARRTGWTRKQAENLVYRGLKEVREDLCQQGLTP